LAKLQTEKYLHQILSFYITFKMYFDLKTYNYHNINYITKMNQLKLKKLLNEKFSDFIVEDASFRLRNIDLQESFIEMAKRHKDTIYIVNENKVNKSFFLYYRIYEDLDIMMKMVVVHKDCIMGIRSDGNKTIDVDETEEERIIRFLKCASTQTKYCDECNNIAFMETRSGNARLCRECYEEMEASRFKFGCTECQVR
jgi:hypothetical protein